MYMIYRALWVMRSKTRIKLFETFQSPIPLFYEVGGEGVEEIHSLGMVREPTSTGLIYCQEAKGLLEVLAGAIRELIMLHEQQFQAVIGGDPDSGRFDDLIHLANEHKLESKYVYLQHLSAHGCSLYH